VLEFFDVEQNTDEWQALRLGKATASNFGIFMANYGKDLGGPAKRYALQLALERINGKKIEHDFTNEHMERGHEQEPLARLLYEETMFCKVSNGGFFGCAEYGDSPDGLVGAVGGIEIKSVLSHVHYANMQRGGFDPAYRWQLIGHLDCTGREWFDFVSYCSDFPEWSRLYTFRLHRGEYAQELEMLRARRSEFLGLVTECQKEIMAYQG
jgi:hypothetical protein